jgi:RimJ/RimL family protein N-acetyltransferase
MNRTPLVGLTLRDGRPAAVRPLGPDDVVPLTAYFLSLSEETRRRYGPHPFDAATAERLCAAWADPATVRFVAVLNDGTAAEIVAYMILTREIWSDDRARYGERLDAAGRTACLAPSVADAYQSQGIGGQMARQVLAWARETGLRQVILMGGVQAPNSRACRLYESLGFRRVGEFWTRNGELLNYDMMLTWDDRAAEPLGPGD